MKAVIVISAMLVSSAAFAQQAQDPTASAYSQLLAEANDRVAHLSAEAAREKEQIAELKKQVDATKKEAATNPPARSASPASPAP